MLQMLTIYFVGAAAGLFLVMLFVRKFEYHGFTVALAINIFPLAFIPQVSMEVARLAGVPLSYLPFYGAALGMLAKTRVSIYKRHRQIFHLFVLFTFYLIFLSIPRSPSFSTLAYVLVWPINFFLFLGACSKFSRCDERVAITVLKHTVFVLVLGCIVGIIRFSIGLASDSNFMPTVNRNGTVVVVALLLPLIPHLQTKGSITRAQAVTYICVVLLTLVLMLSRSGLIGALVGLVLYYVRFNARAVGFVLFAVLFFGLVLLSGIAEGVVERFSGTLSTLVFLHEGGELERGMADYTRFELLRSAIGVIFNNPWFGSGIGLENYRHALEDVGDVFRDSRPHNFYLSYLAELGLVGFTMLILTFSAIYRKLGPYKGDGRIYKVCFIVMAVMMTMNQYIVLPELWFIFGMFSGLAYRSAMPRRLVLQHVRPGGCHEPC